METLHKNSYATMADLELPNVREALTLMEDYQIEFIASTRSIWQPDFPFTGDCLYNWSRQWEYPYCAANIQASQGRVLDAGSGITFFPFYLAKKGYDVYCCDNLPLLKSAFTTACSVTNVAVQFDCESLTKLSYPADFFDSIVCLSVLEHMGHPDRQQAVHEFARILRPGGRLVITCDISLERDTDIRFEDFAVLLKSIRDTFEPLFPLDLHRPANLLTTNSFQEKDAWRLSWRARRPSIFNRLTGRVGQRPFRSLGVIGLTVQKTGS